MADVPFIVEAGGLSHEALARFKRYAFIDDLLFLHEFTTPDLQHKVNFLKTMKQKWVQQPEVFRVETSFRRFPDVRSLLKRTLDLAISSLLLVTLAPVMLLIALAVKFDTGGPVLFATQRTGRGYRIFNLYRFNTIIQDADKKKNGATISKTGMFIRRTCLDELPQLLNVWLGDLSLAGPRALPMYEASRLTTNTCANNFMITPGISTNNGENGKLAIPVDAPMADATDKSDLLYDIWLMANKPPAIIHKTNA
jgi:lipopolysaccharide/colanic/teichoic acid biosynthesis glycosyltransferase